MSVTCHVVGAKYTFSNEIHRVFYSIVASCGAVKRIYRGAAGCQLKQKLIL